ncbi:hypothetical protein LXL04_033531 [Taraxacum kok-saghyz]
MMMRKSHKNNSTKNMIIELGLVFQNLKLANEMNETSKGELKEGGLASVQAIQRLLQAKVKAIGIGLGVQMTGRFAFRFMKGSLTQKLKSMAFPVANHRRYSSSSSSATAAAKPNISQSSRRDRLLAGTTVGLVGGAYASTLDEATFCGWLFTATKVLNPIFALLDPEVAHRLAISAAARAWVPRERRPDQQILGLEVWGRRFSNPIGLAAGFDKNAEAVEGLLGLGFGFVEVGSVTPLPQEGNPKPRMFRLRDQGAIINRCGFNGEGIVAAAERLGKRKSDKTSTSSDDKVKAGQGILGVNIGKNKTSDDAAADYVQGVHALSQYADYLVINISSPNTPGLRKLQGRNQLKDLVEKVQAARNEMQWGKEGPPPLLVKIAPDLSKQDLEDIAAVALALQLDGLIISNTTISRPEVVHSNPVSEEGGGLSGKPLFKLSNDILKDMYILTKGKIPLVGCGGVSSGEDAYKKIRAGATLVQLYTAFAYGGPALIPQIKAELADCLERDGFKSINDALFAGCLALEELVLLDCEWTNLKNVMISSSNLKRLTIDDLPYFGPPDDPGGSKITIDTPNLVLLKYTGFYENILHCWCPIELFHDLQQAAPSPDDPGGCKITIDTPNLVLLKYTGYLSNEILLCGVSELMKVDIRVQSQTAYTRLPSLIMVVLTKFIGGSSSSSTNDHKFDVFLSFRGADTRHGFTDHLHKALLDAHISTFLDDEEIESGGDLKPELESAIKASRASIIVLSKNYANSSWCLDELVLILEQRITSNQIVIPIFYHVDPTDIRNQKNTTYGLSMAGHKQKMEAETNANKRSQLAQKINRWIKALSEVANLKGENADGRRETEFIEEIVEDIYGRLRISSRIPVPQLIGMDYSKKFVTSWLKDASSHTIDILTILGMGGIGKTSLAKYMYALHSHEFDTSSFIEDISRTWNEKRDGDLDIQKKLYEDISKASSIKVHDGSIYTSMIKNALARKKVFLVLDDVDSPDQLNALLGSEGFHPGSKIIITTKDSWLTESCTLLKANVNPKHEKHLLEGLHRGESRQLLCFHAFMSKYPKPGYEEVLEKLVKYCEGHPLALEVLGRSLHKRDVAYWEDCIERVKKDVGSHINKVLRMSFDSLPHEDDKKLFKHIACFFVGTNKDVTETILNACDIETKSGFTHLTDRCLLSIRLDNKVMMHRLLQDMGRLLVRQESPDFAGERSRLWCHEESFKVLKRKKGTKNVLGLTLDMRLLKNVKLRETFELKTDALSKMDNLMLLQLNFVQTINGSYENFPEDLRWLCMHGFPLKSIPLDLPMENLVVLDMSYSNIESFGICYCNPQCSENKQKFAGSCSKDNMLLGSLKILNLSFSKKLSSLGGFDKLPSLEELIVTNCICLVEVCESIVACGELAYIDLSYCKKLEKLPRTIRMLKNVKTLLLKGCNLGESRAEIRDMDLSATNIGTNTNNFSPMDLQRDFKFFTISLPGSLVRLSLAKNKLSTESFPTDFSYLKMLEELNLDHNPIVSLPNCVKSLPRLKRLSMEECVELTAIENLPITITYLNLFCKNYLSFSVGKIAFNPEMSPLELILDWEELPGSSFEIEGMIKITPMASIDEKILHNLGWKKLHFLNKKCLHTALFNDCYWEGEEDEEAENHPSEIQMYYEFGIFSTVYGGKEMPNWIMHTRKGQLLSFIVPSSSKKLRGLNFCSVQKLQYPDKIFSLPMIIIRNRNTNHTWIYRPYIRHARVYEDYFTTLSHWMFGLNEIKGGDWVSIQVVSTSDILNDGWTEQVTEECGVRLVYDDGKTGEEDDVLGYYKSWNHIIGKDLTGFQLLSGEHILDMERCMYSNQYVDPVFHRFVGKGAAYKEDVRFIPLSRRKSDTFGHAIEEAGNSNVMVGKGMELVLGKGHKSGKDMENPFPKAMIISLKSACKWRRKRDGLRTCKGMKFVFGMTAGSSKIQWDLVGTKVQQQTMKKQDDFVNPLEEKIGNGQTSSQSFVFKAPPSEVRGWRQRRDERKEKEKRKKNMS